MTPRFFNAYYNISSNVGHPKATQLVYEAVNQSFSPQDLRTFQADFGLPFTSNLSGDYFGGVETTGDICISDIQSCAEANLDVQWMTAISQYPTKTFLFYDNVTTDITLAVEWIQFLADLTDPPLVISVSYGADEASIANVVDLFNIEFIKVALFICPPNSSF